MPGLPPEGGKGQLQKGEAFPACEEGGVSTEEVMLVVLKRRNFSVKEKMEVLERFFLFLSQKNDCLLLGKKRVVISGVVFSPWDRKHLFCFISFSH